MARRIRAALASAVVLFASASCGVPTPLIVSFIATPERVNFNEEVELRWETTGADAVYLYPSGIEVPAVGSLKVRVHRDATVFQLVAAKGTQLEEREVVLRMNTTPFTGRVVNAKGAPMADVWVTASTLPSVKTDGDGRFSVASGGTVADVMIQNPNLSASATRQFLYKAVPDGSELALDGYVAGEERYATIEATLEGSAPAPAPGNYVATRLFIIGGRATVSLGAQFDLSSVFAFESSVPLESIGPGNPDLLVIRYEVTPQLQFVRFIAAGHVPALQLVEGQTLALGTVGLQDIGDVEQPLHISGPSWVTKANVSIELVLNGSGRRFELDQRPVLPAGATSLHLPQLTFAQANVTATASSSSGYSAVRAPITTPGSPVELVLPDLPAISAPAEGELIRYSGPLAWTTPFAQPKCALSIYDQYRRVAVIVTPSTETDLLHADSYPVQLGAAGTYQWDVLCTAGGSHLDLGGESLQPPWARSERQSFEYAPQ